MNIRFYNARILTMEDNKDIFEGELWTCESRIFYVGTKEDAPEKIPFDREIDCNKNLIMPGFKNAHTHSAMTFLRSHADDLPLGDWLNNQVFPFEAKLSAEDIKELTKLAILEYLTSGITSIMEMYLTPESIADACEELGMRIVQTGGMNNFSQSIELQEEWYAKLNNRTSLSSYVPGFHAEYTCSEELLKEMSKFVNKLQAPCFAHICETKSEVEGCVERHGMTPFVYLDSLGLFNYGGGGYHCVHISDEDLEVIKKRKLFVITNPGSNTKLASGIAPIEQYLKEGVDLAIGTDGPASNNCLDMFREMFLVTGLAKLKSEDASAVDAKEVLKMATVGGAKAMGLRDCDVLSRGKLADLIMIDLNKPNMRPIHNIEKNLVYSGSKANVKLTMIDGKILYEDGKFNLPVSETKIYDICEEITKKICY